MTYCGNYDYTYGGWSGGTAENTMTWESLNCDDSLSSHYKYKQGIQAKDGQWGYDKVHDYKPVFLNSFFTDIPDSLVSTNGCHDGDSSCFDYSCQDARPIRVDYLLEHNDAWDYYDFKINNPAPNGSESDGTYDGIQNVVLSLIGGFGPFAAAGSAAISEFIDTGSIDPVVCTQKDLNGDKQQIYWELKMNGQDRSDFPQSVCDSTGVQFEIDNNLPAGNTGGIDTWSRYTFAYPTYHDTDCICYPYITINRKTTQWNYAYGEFTSA